MIILFATWVLVNSIKFYKLITGKGIFTEQPKFITEYTNDIRVSMKEKRKTLAAPQNRRRRETRGNNPQPEN